MSPETHDTLVTWLCAPSFVIVLVIGVWSYAVSPRRTSARRYGRESETLRAKAREAQGLGTFQLDWLDYKQLTKAELTDICAEYSWSYSQQDITHKGWLISFVPYAGCGAGESADAAAAGRLQCKLQEETPNAYGRYVLDISSYRQLPLLEIFGVAREAGWEVVDGSSASWRSEITLARPGHTALTSSAGSFVGGSSPEQLRNNPKVVSRAVEVKQSQGFDPTSERTVERARQRHQYWQKKFNRQFGLMFLYAVLGVVFLAALFGGGAFDEYEEAAYVLVVLPIIFLLLAGIAGWKAMRVLRARKAELGDFYDTYEELNRIADDDSHPGS